MKRLLLAPLILVLGLPAQADKTKETPPTRLNEYVDFGETLKKPQREARETAHDKCLNAADYKGCVDYQ